MTRTIRLSLAILAFSTSTTGAFAQAGSLDPTFATAGIGTYLPQSQNDDGLDIIALSDNSMLVCGAYISGGFVTHILEDGTVDAAFGESNGYTFFGGGLFAMALAPDQSIYLAGVVSAYVLLAHISASGIPDPDFGTDGALITSVGSIPTALQDMVIQPDGKIVVVGHGDFPASGFYSDPYFARFLPDGSSDTSFNSTGVVTFHSSSASGYMHALALMNDGSIVGVGWSEDGTTERIMMIKANADGTPDLSFGTAGMLSPSLGGTLEYGYDILVKDGSMYVVGKTGNNDIENTYIAKFNTDGVLDPTFGVNGRTINHFGSFDYLYRLAAQSDGKFVACGGTGASMSDHALMMMRFGSNGTLDYTFGDAGRTITNVSLISDYPYGISIQPNGKILVTGGKKNADQHFSMIVLRYLTDDDIGIADNDTSTRQFAVYPNPVSGNSTTLSLPNAKGAEVWITDMQGRRVSSSINTPQGITSMPLSTSGLDTGNYLVNLQSQGTTTTLKMQVVQ